MATLIAVSFVTAGCGASAETPDEASDAEFQPLISPADPSLAGGPDNAPAFGDSVDALFDPGQVAPPIAPAGYEPFEWEDLQAPGSSTEEEDTKFLALLDEVEEGTPEANALYEEWQAAIDAKGQLVNTELDGKKIFMAGFVTPLDFEADVITEFLFVPYFGACIHVPPPPVNQTVMVTLDSDEALAIEDTWGAVWVAGQLTATSATTDLATAGYTITEASTEVADEF